jgi:gamma-glutamylaminecyclotransferase
MNKSSNPIYVAAYGTLRKGYSNNRLMNLSGNFYVGAGITKEKYAMYSSGIPFVIKEPKTPIVVDVFEVDSANLPRIDSLEGHPNWYRRELIPVLVNGKELQCWLYFMTDDRVKNYKFISTGNYQ